MKKDITSFEVPNPDGILALKKLLESKKTESRSPNCTGKYKYLDEVVDEVIENGYYVSNDSKEEFFEASPHSERARKICAIQMLVRKNAPRFSFQSSGNGRYKFYQQPDEEI